MPSPWLWTFVLALLAYVTSWPMDRLPGGDSGELLAEVCVGGVAHPPGYPLLLSLLRLLRWTAQKCCGVAGYGYINSMHFVQLANVMNVFMAAGAAACVTHTVHLLLSKNAYLEAIAAGMSFALSKLTWEYATGVEVFALNNLLVGLLHVLVVGHFLQPTTKNACVGALVCGLGLANQHTIVLLEAPYILWVLLTRRFQVVELLLVAVTFLAGLSIYLQTIISGLEPTPGSWGDTSTLEGLFNHFRRKEYGTFRLSPLSGESEGLLLRLEVYARDCLADFHWTSLALMCLGAKVLLFPERVHNKNTEKYQRAGYAQMSAFVCYLVVFHSLANLPLNSPMPRAVSSRFNMQPNTILAIWFGIGLATVTRKIASFAAADDNFTRIVRFSICVTLVASQYERNQYIGDDLHEDMIRRHGEAIFDVVPRDAVVLSYTDINWNSLRYLQACEDVRTDVTHLSLQLLPFPWFPRQHLLYPTIAFPQVQRDVSTVKGSPGYAKLLRDFLDANMGQHGDHLFLDLHAVNDEDIAPNGQYLGFTLTPHGLVWKVTLPPSTTAESDALYTQWSLMSPPPVRFNPLLYPPGSWEFAAAAIANDACYQGALYALSYWLERGKTIQHASQAASYVLGMQQAWSLLSQVEEDAATSDGSRGLTYEAYDLFKNTALASVRYSEGLDLMKPLIAPLQEHQRRHGASREEKAELQQLQKLVKPSIETRQRAVRRVESLLPDMILRQDPDTKVFKDFIDDQAPKTKKTKRKSKKKKKKRKA